MAYTGTTPGLRGASSYTGTNPRGFQASSLRRPKLPSWATNGAQDPGQPPPAYPGGVAPQQRKPGLLEAPGAYEQWYSGYQARGPRQNRRGDYWNGIQGQMGGGRTASAYGTMKSTLEGPRRGVQGARDAASYFSTPGQGEQWTRANAGGFDGPGVAENNYGNVQRTLGGIQYGQSAVRDTQQGVKGANRTGGYFDNTLSQYANGNSVADEMTYFSPGLREKSYSEQAYESGAGGLIDPYQRTMDKSIRAARDAAAARGQFNSERGVAMEREVTADIAAQEAQDRIALAGQADQARIARTGAARDFSTASEQAGASRKALGLEGAMGADAGVRDNLGLMQDAYGMASEEALSKVGLETDAADVSQRSMIDRLMSGGQFHRANDAASRDRVRMGVDANLDADKAEENLMDQLLRAAGYADGEERAGQRHGMDMAGLADDAQRDIDDFDAGAADKMQDRFENRNRNMLSDIRGNAQDQIHVLLQGTDRATQQYFQEKMDALQAEVDSGAITQQQRDQRMEELYMSAANYVRTRQPAPTGGGK